MARHDGAGTPAGWAPISAGAGPRPLAPELRCTGLTIELGGRTVLRELDLHVPAGTVTALVGASGSGKTTLIKHVLGLLEPDEGSVAIGGQQVWESTPAQLLEIRRNLSALHSGSTIYDGSVFAALSVRDNILAVLHEKHANPATAVGGTRRGGSVTNPYLKQWVEGVARPKPVPELAERARYWLDRLDLTAVADQQPHEVAAGLRRRAALGGALAVDAPLYVLDDLDGSIDATHRDVIVRALLDTHERTGATMLIATHDIELAQAIADRMAVLAGGRIVFHGEPEVALARLPQWYSQEDEDSLETLGIPRARRPSEPRRAAAAPTERVTPKESRTAVWPTVVTVLVFVGLLMLFVLAIPRF